MKAIALGKAVSCRRLTAEDRVRFQVNLDGISGCKGDTETCFSPSTSVFPCQYHSTVAPYSYIYLFVTLCNLSSSQRP